MTGVVRGSILSCGKKPIATKVLNSLVFSMTESDISKGQTLSCQCGTQAVRGTISDINERIDSSTLEKISDRSKIGATQVAQVKIELDAPLIVEEFKDVPGLGRFVLVKDGDIQLAGIIT